MTQNELLLLIIKICDFEYLPKKGVFELVEKVEWYKKHVDTIKEIAEEASSMAAHPVIVIPSGTTVMQLCSCEKLQDVQSQGRSNRSVQE